MRYFILLFFLSIFSQSYAVIPSESINNTSIATIKEETKPKKEIKKQRKTERKDKKQLKKQIQKIKWQILKNALKVKKSDKTLDKKDKKPAYRSSRLSVLFALLGYILFAIGIGVSGVIYGGILIAIPFSIIALVHVIKSLRFIRNNPKTKNDTYGRGKSIFLTIIGIYLSLPVISIAIFFLLFPFFIN